MTGEHLHHNNGNPDDTSDNRLGSNLRVCIFYVGKASCKAHLYLISLFFCKDVREAEDWMPRDFQLRKKIDNQPFDILKAS